MLSHLIRRSYFLAPIVPSASFSTIAKSIAEKKKKIYESQTKLGKSAPISQSINLEQQKQRATKFEQQLFLSGKEVIQIFNNKQKNAGELAAAVKQSSAKLTKSMQKLEKLQLINYVEIMKNLCFSKLENLEYIERVYAEISEFVNQPDNIKTVKDLQSSLWNENTPFQTQIRAVSLLQFMDASSRSIYLQKIIPLIKYFKSTQMLILLYQKWKYQYKYSYELLDQIHLNQFFLNVEDINHSYFKMLFVQTIRGEFSPNEDSIYQRMLMAFQQKPTILTHTTFRKFVQMLHSQSYFIETDLCRMMMQSSLNNFINIAKNQNYDKSDMDLSQLVEIYLGFEESNSSGEILLSQINYFSKNPHFKITKENLAIYQKLMFSVMKNIEKKLKYEHKDILNKEYTNDTLNFLREFLPKYIKIWPEVIFEINSAAYELFPPSNTPDALLVSFVEPFKKIIEKSKNNIGISNLSFTLKVLHFLITHQKSNLFVIPEDTYISILNAILTKSKTQNITNQQLQIIYIVISLLGQKIKSPTYRSLMVRITSQIIDKQIKKELEKSVAIGPINSYDFNIVWLSLCSAKLMKYKLPINVETLEIFINQKLYYMINSLQYLEVYEILEFTVKIQRLKPQIYEKLLFNLSTFVMYISDQTSRQATSYYLNHKYLDYYKTICQLVLKNKTIFKKIVNKDSFKILQIMFIKHFDSFSNADVLSFLEILADPSFLSPSMKKELESIKFTPAQFEPYESSKVLRSFEYYNNSLLRFYEGKYNESEIKKRLMGSSLTKQEIQDYFSKSEVYKTIIMDGQLNIRFQLPEPQTTHIDYKYMYICQRIYQRIKMFNNYEFHENLKFNAEEPLVFKEVDLKNQKAYITEEELIPRISINEFRIQNRVLPKYLKLQVWKTNVFFDKQCKIEAKDLSLNNQKLTDEILSKVIKGVEGSYEKIKEVIKEFNSNDQLLNMMKQEKIQYQQNGAAIQLKKEGSEQIEFTLLCANNINYKILYICAHLMAKNGFKVAIIKQGQKIEPVINFLKTHFLESRKTTGEKKESEDDNESEQ